jgi:hypothetical protein
MIILKDRSKYLDDKAGGDGITGSIIRIFSKDARKCDKGRHGEDAIIDVLRGLDDSCYLINDVVLPSSHGNIDHVLLTPKCIFALETKHWEGNIVCRGDDWSRHYREGIFSSKKFNIGSPSKQVKRNAFDLSKIIESGLFHNTFNVWVEGVVVFTNRQVSLKIYEPSVAVLRVEELYNYIFSSKKIAGLSKRDLESIGKFILDINSG